MGRGSAPLFPVAIHRLTADDRLGNLGVLRGGCALELANYGRSKSGVGCLTGVEDQDTRYPGPSVGSPAADQRIEREPLPWMSDKGFTGFPNDFFNAQKKIRIDEGNDGTVDQSFTLWATLVPAGIYHTSANSFSGNNYLIIGSRKVVPEPSSLTLLGLGLMGLVGGARSRRGTDCPARQGRWGQGEVLEVAA